MKLGRSFINIYGFVVILFIASGLILDEVWHEYVKNDAQSYAGYETLLEALEQYGLDNPKEQWQQRFSDFSTRFDIPLRLGKVNEFDMESDKQLIQLNSGQTIVKNDDKFLYLARAIGTDNDIIILGPMPVPERPGVGVGLRVLIFGGIGAILMIWLWPISKDLEQLKKAAAAFGQGDLSARAGPPKSNTMRTTVNAFNLMAMRIKRLVDAFKELTSAISHELRTPLARSKFALQILEGIDERKKQQKYLDQIRSDVHELEELINEMLVYASFDSDKPKLQMSSWSVREIIDNQLSSHKDFSSDIEISIQGNDFNVICDRHFIERALSNFITNANKYGGDKIKIEATMDKEFFTIAIHDNGPGVGDDFKNHAFDAFTRADVSRNKDTAGFGLGLAIVQRVMEWHQGIAFVDDSQLGGAVFGLKWPKNLEIS